MLSECALLSAGLEHTYLMRVNVQEETVIAEGKRKQETSNS